MKVQSLKIKSGQLKSTGPGVRSSNPIGASWSFRLYIAGRTQKSRNALSNLKLICEGQLKGKYRIKVIDLLKYPGLAREHQILAIPTLVRKIPRPVKNIIGDLSNTGNVLMGLDLSECGAQSLNKRSTRAGADGSSAMLKTPRGGAENNSVSTQEELLFMSTSANSTRRIEDDLSSLPISRQRKYQIRNMRQGRCIICGNEVFAPTIFCYYDNIKRGILAPGKNKSHERKWS